MDKLDPVRRRGWAAFMVMTASKTPHEMITEGIQANPGDPGNYLYLVLVKDKNPAKDDKTVLPLETVIIPLDICPINPKYYLPCFFHGHQAQADYNLTDFIHHAVFCDKIIKIDRIDRSEHEKRTWHNVERTGYYDDKKLSRKQWITIFSLLVSLRDDLSNTAIAVKRHKSKRPPQKAFENFDVLSRAVVLWIKMVNTTLNTLLETGDLSKLGLHSEKEEIHDLPVSLEKTKEILQGYGSGSLMIESIISQFLHYLDRLICDRSIVSNDKRQTIREIIANSNSLQHFVVKDGSKPLGNHFHTETKEVFIFLSGGGKIFLRPILPAGSDISLKQYQKTTEEEIKPGMIVEVNQSWAHRLELDSGTVFLVWKSRTHDPDHPDTVTYEI